MAAELNPYEAPTSPQAIPETSLKKRRRGTTYFVLTLTMLVLSLPAVLVVRNQVVKVFDDFELALPTIFQLAIHWAFPVLIGPVIAAFVLKEFLPISEPVKRRINIAVALLTIVTAMLFAFGVFAPLLRVIWDIN